MAKLVKRLLLIVCLLLPQLLLATVRVYKGNSTSSTAIYYLEDNGRLHKGNSTSGTTVYFLDFTRKRIHKGSSSSSTALFTIDNNNCLRKGASTSGTALYKYDRNKIYKGSSTSGSALYTLNGKYLHKGSSSSSTALYTFDKQKDIPLELIFFIVAVVEPESSAPDDDTCLYVYEGHYASGKPLFTLKDNRLYKGQYASGPAFYTFQGNKLYEGHYASGAADYIYDRNGRLYKGQYASGTAIFKYENNHIYRGHYASGAADFTISGNHFYRGQYASGAAAYTFKNYGEHVPLDLLFFLVAVVEPKPETPIVKPEDTAIQLNDDEQSLVSRMAADVAGTTFDAITVRGTADDIRACLALGVLPHMTSEGMATFNRPAVEVTGFDPASGILSMEATPGAGGSLRADYPVQTKALHVQAAESTDAFGTGDELPLPIAHASAHGSGTATLHLRLPGTRTLFLRIRVEP